MFIKKISCNELHELINDPAKKLALIDVREKEELEQGVLPGSVHYPMSSFTEQPLPESDLYIFYCRSGYRSGVAAEYVMMQDANKAIYNLTGGINAWIMHGFKLEK